MRPRLFPQVRAVQRFAEVRRRPIPWLYRGCTEALRRKPPLAAVAVTRARPRDDRLALVKVLEQYWGWPNTPLQVLEFVVPHG
jgi:hypothetical protein